ncbi:MAG: hypothetical protein ACRDUB_07250 [Mycobacterium sp.]
MAGTGGGLRDRAVVIGVGVAVVLGVAVLIGSLTGWFGLTGDPRHDAATTACQDAVRGTLAAPLTAQFGTLRAREDSLSEDDHVRLGFDAGKVAAVWAVNGTVNSQGRDGKNASLEFACRAAFFDDKAIRTSINYGSADLPGQLKGRA